MVKLGMANSRMKDFYDVWFLAGSFPFDGQELSGAIRATLERHGPLSQEPALALTPEFYADPQKTAQWRAFLRRSGLLDKASPLDQTCLLLRDFLIPAARVASTSQAFDLVWPPGGPWR